MKTFTLLVPDSPLGTHVRAIDFLAETARGALDLARQLDLPERCELWSEGTYICSMRRLPGRDVGWYLLSSDG